MLGDASTSSDPSPKLSLHDKFLHRPGALSSGRLQEASILLGLLSVCIVLQFLDQTLLSPSAATGAYLSMPVAACN